MSKKLNNMISPPEPVAIIGMGCRFPGHANDPYLFWENLKQGKDCITEIPENRYNRKKYYSQVKEKPGRIISRWGGYIDGFDMFDPDFFGITRREAPYLDPQQRKLLQVTWEALEDGGQKPAELAGQPVGVFIGAFTLDYKILQFGTESLDAIASHTATGSMMTMVSNRISYVYDFKGPSLSLDTACSSSLVAVHLACESIRRGESSMALAGGTLLQFIPQYTIAESKGGFLSPTGWSHAFDSSANGYVRAEGVGVVVLKKLSEALADGDPVHAVIIGGGVNQDGHTKGITVPNPDSQIALMHRVYKEAGVSPGEIQYVEAHGTGTPVGDPIEANALGQVLRTGRKPEDRCFIGSVKTNIGHSEAAAGIAGLIKTVMALKNKQIPPHLHLKELNPKIKIDRWPCTIPGKLEPWPAHKGPARAGVNSFGFGGTNAHIIVQEAPPESGQTGKTERVNHRPVLFALTARDEEVFPAMVKKYKSRIEENPSESYLTDMGYTLSHFREHLDRRLVFRYSCREELLEKMNGYLEGEEDPGTVSENAATSPRLVWVFTGMGPQWWAMGRELYVKEPVFRKVIDACHREIMKTAGWSLKQEMMEITEEESSMGSTRISQPANFALQIGLAALWREMGIHPDAIVGHSTGEVAAAYEAGVYTLEEAVRIIIHRSRLQATLSGKGKMVAVGLSEEEVLPLIEPYGAKVSIAAINSPAAVTLSGDENILQEILAPLKEGDIFFKFLKVEIPFHSPAMEPIRGELLSCLKGLSPEATAVPFYSTALGRRVEGEELDAGYWWQNIRGSVLFTETVFNLLDDGYHHFLEIGPHPVLKNSIKECLAFKKIPGFTICSLRRNEDEQSRMVNSLGKLFALGFSIDWKKIYTRGNFIPLPAYSWNDERFWAVHIRDERMRVGHGDHPLLGEKIFSPEPVWGQKIDTEYLPYLKDHRIQGSVVFPAAGFIEMAFSALKYIKGEGICSVDELEIRKALFLSEKEPALTWFLFDESRFKVVTYDVEKNHQNTLHVAGKIRSLPEAAIAPNFNPEEVVNRLPELVDAERCYEVLGRLGYNYGPAFQGIQHIRVNKTEALARIEIPDVIKPGMEDYQFHPAMLDACFQTFIAPRILDYKEGEPVDGVRIPVSVKHIKIGREKIGSCIWAHARILVQDEEMTAGDILIYNDAGLAVCEIKGFAAHSTEKGTGNVGTDHIDNWIYEVAWEPEEAEPLPEKDEVNYALQKSAGSGWLILSDSAGMGGALAECLEEKGENCIIALAGSTFSEKEAGRLYTVQANNNEHISELFHKGFTGRDWYCKGVIHLWGLDAPDPESFNVEILEEVKKNGIFSLLPLSRAMTGQGIKSPLFIVTRGTQHVTPSSIMLPAAAPVWGLGRVLFYQEMVEQKGKLIDLDPVAPVFENVKFLLSEIANPGDEDEIAIREGTRYTSRMKRATGLPRPMNSKFRKDGCYLITGAYGALGKILCKLLIKNGASRLVLLSRGAIPPREEWDSLDEEKGVTAGRVGFIQELEASGVHVIPLCADLRDEKSFREAIREFKTLGYPPFRGVFQCAGVVQDALISTMDEETFDKVYNPKVTGAFLLHNYFLNEPLEHFVLFSSIASLVTTAGQTNYAAGNAFLDSLAEYRRSIGLPGQSINWGPWAVGMIRELDLIEHYRKNRGMMCIPEEAGMSVMDRVFGLDTAQLVVTADVDWPVFLAWYPVGVPLINLLIEKGSGNSGKEDSGFIDKFKQTDENFRRALVQEHFIDLISRVLHAKRSKIENTTTLSKLGMDSILAIEVRNKILNDMGCSVTVVNLLSRMTISELSGKIYENLNVMLESSDTNNEPESSFKPITDENEYPLTWGQKAIWFLKQLNPSSPAYNIAGAVRIPVMLDTELFKEAISRFIMAHASLRANFVIKENKPVQIIKDYVDMDFRVIDATGWDKATLLESMTTEYRNPFQLESGPLIRFHMYKQGDEGFVIMYNVHHIISDAISTFITVDGILGNYDSLVKNKPVKQSIPDSSYLDFYNWQSKFLTTSRARGMYEYWKNHLPREIPVLTLPTDKARPIVQTNNGDSCFFILTRELTSRVHELADETGTTVYMILLSAFYILLHRYSNQEDIIVGSPVSGRTQDEFSDVYGYFVNPLPLCASFKNDPTYIDFLSRVQKTVLNGLDNQEYPFALLVEKLNLKHDPSRSAIFQVMFILLVHRVENTMEKYGFDMDYMELPEEEGQFDITLSFYEDIPKGEFHGVFKYNTDLFNESTIRRMVDHYRNLLNQILGDRTRCVSSYELVSSSEKKMILRDWGRSKSTAEVKETIVQLIEKRAGFTPSSIAVSVPDDNDEMAGIDYESLNHRANQLARYLMTRDLGPGSVAAVCMEKSIDLMVSILAILKTGAAYLPVDPGYPRDRVQFMLDNSSAVMLLCHDLTIPSDAGGSIPVVNIDELHGELVGEEIFNPERNIDLDTPAYIVYTSGSTGKPKGVIVSHRNWATVYRGWEVEYNLKDQAAVQLQMASFAFDVFAGDFVRGLCSGGRLILCTRELLLDIPRLYSLMKREGVQSAEFVPAIMRNLMLYLKKKNLNLDFMNLVIVGSDSWKIGEYRMLKSFCDEHTRVINSYGLSEATIDSTYFAGSVEEYEEEQPVPIGSPFPGTSVFVLDKNKKLLPAGITGELYIGGNAVATGYIGAGELTEQRFITITPDDDKPVRVYKTGDMAQWGADGNLHLLGRIDNQIKIRGHRVELDEIEKHLVAFPGIAEAMVAVKSVREEKVLCSYYITVDPGREIDIKSLRIWLNEKLPLYMIPAFFVQLERFPFTPNGKVDINGLPDPEQCLDNAGDDFPQTLYEKKIAEIWMDLFGIDRVGIQHDFFEIGGSSIKLVELLIRIQEEFNIRVSVSQLFKATTLMAMSKTVEDIVTGKEEGARLYIVFNGDRENTLYCFPPAGGYSIIYQPLASHLTDYRFVSFNYYPGEEKIAKYSDIIIEDGFLDNSFLFGYSLGGNMAFEVAKELESRGRKVGGIIIMDSYRIMQAFTPSEEDLAGLRLELGAHLKRHTYTEKVHDHIFSLASDYIRFFSRNLNLGSSVAPVHVLLEEGDTRVYKTASFSVTKESSWRDSSQNQLNIYKGAGRHEDMLSDDNLADNAFLIKGVLDNKYAEVFEKKASVEIN